jgi:hypothetical protein
MPDPIILKSPRTHAPQNARRSEAGIHAPQNAKRATLNQKQESACLAAGVDTKPITKDPVDLKP